MMGKCFGPKCFLASALFLLTILSIYGIVGALLTYRQASKIPTFGDWPFNLRPVYCAFIVIQALFPVAGVFGLLAVCKKQPMFLYGSGSVLLGIFTCCCVFGSVSVRLNTQDITDEFYKTVKTNLLLNTVDNENVTDWLNDVQWQHKCCGVYSFHDYYRFGDTEDVPSSCCRHDVAIPRSRCGRGIITEASASRIKPHHHIYIQGCNHTISTSIQNSSRRLGTEILVAGGVAFITAAYIYICVTKMFLKTRSNKVNRDANGNIINPNDDGCPSSSIGTNLTSATNSNVDANNNFPHRKDSNFRRQRLLQKQRSKLGKGRHSGSRFRPPFGPLVNSQSKFVRPVSRNEINGNISASKSFILGESRSNEITHGAEGKDTDLFRKNVDMLWYQSLEKNVSALSTTPNDSSYFTLDDQRNTVYTLVSERPFTPSLSQNCSMSVFNNNHGKTTLGGNGENIQTPTTTGSHHLSNQKQRVLGSVQAEELTEEPESEGETDASSEVNEITTSTLPSITPATIEVDTCNLPTFDVTAEQGISEETPPPSIAAAKFNPTSSVRSTTLSTIQEESESTKGSPGATKAASPASGYMSPEGVTPRQTEADLSEKTQKNGNVSDSPECGNANNNNSACAGDNESFERAGEGVLTKITSDLNENRTSVDKIGAAENDNRTHSHSVPS